MKWNTSYKELEQLGTNLARDYTMKTHRWAAQCFDIEGFIRDYLRLEICYETFAEADSSKVGFLSDGHYPLTIRRNGVVQQVIFPKDTIVIDKYLLRPDESARRRFTLAHEAGHVIKNRHSPMRTAPCFHNEYDNEQDYSAEDLRRMLSLEETLVSRLGAAILMPDFLVARALTKFNESQKLLCYEGSIFAMEEKLKAQKMANCLGVSYSAFITRLRELNLLDVHPFEEYSEKLIGNGGMMPQ